MPRDDDFSNLDWKDLPRTEGRYQVAFAKFIDSPNQGVRESFITLHIRQRFWIKEKKGVDIDIDYEALSIDKVTKLEPSRGPLKIAFSKKEKDTWAIMSTPLFSSRFLDLICSCSKKFLSFSILLADPLVATQQRFYINFRVTVFAKFTLRIV